MKNKTVLTIRVKEEILDRLKEEATKKGITISLLSSSILESYFNIKEIDKKSRRLTNYRYVSKH